MRGDDDVVELMVLDADGCRDASAAIRTTTEKAPPITPATMANAQVKGADVLVVGRAQPAGKEAGAVAMTIGLMAMLVGDVGVMLVSHRFAPSISVAGGRRAAPSGEPGAAATRSASAPSSRCANFFLASSSHRWKASFATAYDLDRHEGVIDAADLVALAVIDALVLDFHPALVEPADDRVFLDAEGRHEPAVDHVGAGDLDADDRVDWDDQRVVDVEEPLLAQASARLPE